MWIHALALAVMCLCVLLVLVWCVQRRWLPGALLGAGMWALIIGAEGHFVGWW